MTKAITVAILLFVWFVIYRIGLMLVVVAAILFACFALCGYAMERVMSAPRYDRVNAHSCALGMVASGGALAIVLWFLLGVSS